MIPIFRSHYSICSSILTLDPPEKIDELAPISVFSIAQAHGLKDVFLAEKSMSGYIEAFKNSSKAGIRLHFGVEMICCADVKDKSEESFKTEHKIIVWLRNSKSYSQFCKLISFANTEGFYYIPRIDEAHLEKFIDENMKVTIPFYDSFICNNLLTFSQCSFDCNKFKPVFFYEESELPFDGIITNGINAASKGFETLKTRTVLYYKNENIGSYLTMRCMAKRTDWDKPNLDHFSSDKFSFEAYLQQSTK